MVFVMQRFFWEEVCIYRDVKYDLIFEKGPFPAQ